VRAHAEPYCPAATSSIRVLTGAARSCVGSQQTFDVQIRSA
jgi:hypothetical protein